MTINGHHLTTIIPNFNGKRFLQICLDSIIRQTFHDFSVIVVDNGSVDGSVEFIRNHYADVQVVEFKENKGFGAAVNEGIKKANSQYICLLNNDIELDSNFLKEMVMILEERNEIDYCAAEIFQNFEFGKRGNEIHI